jgi:spore coat polysaccharide biosynthesis protein SpsF (cytidylyltransferase family)/predicted dehydrogenase
LRFLVVGCGSIGKRHLQNLKLLSAGELVAYDTREDRREEVRKQFEIEVLANFEDAMHHLPNIVLVCTPTSRHIEYALRAARAGCHLFIEKPISDTLEGLSELIESISSKNLVCLVGCNFRFHWGLKLVKKLVEQGRIGRLLCARAEFGQYLPDWHPREDYRKGYSANKALGGGIILDAIHEIDYVHWMMGKVDAVSCFAGKQSSLEINTEDTAEVLLRFQSGAIAEIHMDYIQRTYNRSCELIGEEGTITWSLQDNQVRLYSTKDKDWQLCAQNAPYEINEMYLAEMEHFLRCIRREELPLLDAREAKDSLEIALAAKESSETGRVINLQRGALITAIIQARMSSTRLPGKVLLNIQGKPLLGHVIYRIKASRLINQIVIATSSNEKDRAIINFAQQCGIPYYVGSEDDVLDRFYQTARSFGADVIVRITSDDPFIDPEVIDRVVTFYLNHQDSLDYASNWIKPTYPEGLDVEVFSFAALEKAWLEAKKPSEREHVTPYIWNHPELFRLSNIENEEDLSNLRWTVDIEADLRFTREIYARLYHGQVFLMKDVLALLSREPELNLINSGVAKRAGYLKSLEQEETR